MVLTGVIGTENGITVLAGSKEYRLSAGLFGAPYVEQISRVSPLQTAVDPVSGEERDLVLDALKDDPLYAAFEARVAMTDEERELYDSVWNVSANDVM